MMDSESRDCSKIFLFDVDGTLTEPRKVITSSMEGFLEKLRKKVKVGLVGGSDLVKIAEQMGGDEVVNKFDFVFAENGLIGYKNGEKFVQENITKQVGEEKLQKLINFCLSYMSKLELPCKRGTFIDYRNGLINVCPVGRSCSQEERDAFGHYDKVHNIRAKFVEAIKNEFPDLEMKYAIGGQISFDMFPIGWDKTYCLQFILQDGIKEVYFFGDKTFEGGNDHEIYNDPRTIGHKVTSPSDTKAIIQKLLNIE